MATTLCIVDTNVLLHSQPLSQIPWRDLLQADAIEIILVSRVLRELDEKKNGDSEKLKKRAKRVLSQINEWLPPGTRTTSISDGIAIRVHTREPAKREGLDFSVSDDRIIASALELREGADVWLITGDTAMRFKAEDFGLRVLALPDAYRLRDEEPAKSTRPPAPRLVVGFFDQDGHHTSHIEVRSAGLSATDELADAERRLDALERQAAEAEQKLRTEQELLEKRVREKAPFAEFALREHRDRQRWGGMRNILAEPSQEPSADEWQRHIAALRKFNQRHADTVTLSIGVANLGTAPASDIIIDVVFPASSNLTDFRPRAPEPPQGQQVFMRNALLSASMSNAAAAAIRPAPANTFHVRREDDLINVRITSTRLMHSKHIKWPIWLDVREGFQVRGRVLAGSPPLDEEFDLNIRRARH